MIFFSVNAHWLRDSFESKFVHLQVIQMDGTLCTEIALRLEELITEYQLANKFIAFVIGGGSNLKFCSRELSGLVSSPCN